MENIENRIVKLERRDFCITMIRFYTSNMCLRSKDFIQNERKEIFETRSVEIKWNIQYRHFICSGVMTPFFVVG
jgi:hypothetical protein